MISTCKKEKEDPQNGEHIKEWRGSLQLSSSPKAQFSQAHIDLLQSFLMSSGHKISTRSETTRPDRPDDQTFWPDPTCTFLLLSVSGSPKNRDLAGPTTRPFWPDPTTSLILKRFWCTYNGNKIYTLWWTYVVGGVGAGPAFSVSFVRPPWRLENRSKTFVIDPKVCSRSTISKSFSVTFHSFMSLPHHTLPNHQRKRDTCETLYTNSI